MSKMVKISRQNGGLSPVSGSWSFRKKLIVGMVLGSAAVGLFAGYHIVKSVRQILALQVAIKSINSGGPSLPPVKLPMDKAYNSSSIHSDVSRAWFCKEKIEFLKLMDLHEEEVGKLTDLMSGTGYEEDWITGVSNLNTIIPANHIIDLNAPQANFRQLREFSNIISALAVYSSYKGDGHKAAKLLMANIALVRQFISHDNENNGVLLIDAMIAIAMVNNLKKTVDKTNGFNGYNATLFPILKERWEAADSLFPLVGHALMIEREMLPSFFHRFNEKAGKEMGPGTVFIDEKWMNEKLDYYFAPIETFELPYPQANEVMNKYNKRLMKAGELTSGPGFYWTGLTSPFKAVFQVLLAIAVPNYVRAYEKECITRSDLRGIYLSFAIHYYKAKEGEYPENLDGLKSYVKPEMIIDPYTGKQFSYRRRFDKVGLTTERSGEKITFLDF